jgi:beta-catenin-like protein 1
MLPDSPTPDMLKKMRLGSVITHGDDDTTVPSINPPRATVEDDNDFAPGGDADYFVEEDEEGRFFGGGLTSEQKDILNIFDNAGGEGVDEVLDLLSPST